MMTMGASIVTYTVEAENAAELHSRVRDYLVPAARKTGGYRGCAARSGRRQANGRARVRFGCGCQAAQEA